MNDYRRYPGSAFAGQGKIWQTIDVLKHCHPGGSHIAILGTLPPHLSHPHLPAIGKSRLEPGLMPKSHQLDIILAPSLCEVVYES